MNRYQCSTRIIFYTLWVLASVLQALFTELFHDEAYYWKYSQDLAWGYFDHPPMIAVVVKLGYLIFQNELGIRLVIILMNTSTIFLIEKIINPRDVRLFYILIASIVLLHYGGVLAIPDNPLLFFTATFYYLYQQFTQRYNWWWMPLLGINAGLLMLSKYHGALVIIATLISNPGLLRKFQTWLALAISLLVFTPHFIWQYQNGFPSINYQLFSRSVTVFDIAYVLEFIFTQPIIYGPIIGFLLIYFAFREKASGDFEKALKYNLIGVFALFFFATFKGKVEAHWTDIAIIPLLYFGYRGIAGSPKIRRFAFRSFPVSLTLILLMRIYLMVDFLPKKWNVRTEFHGWDEWAKNIAENIRFRTVVFDNSYQNAAKFEFYSGLPTICQTNQRGRINQYDIWKAEEQIQGRDITFLPWIKNPDLKSIQTPLGEFPFVSIPGYQTFPGLSIEIQETEVFLNQGESLKLRLNFSKKPGYEGKQIMQNRSAGLVAVAFDEQNRMIIYPTGNRITDDLIDRSGSLDVEIIPQGEGKQAIYFTITNHNFPPTVHSMPVLANIK